MSEIFANLGIEGGLLLSQIINFLLLMLLLRMFLYRPVLNMLERRKERIAQSMKDAERVSAAVVQWDAKFGLVKVNPLLYWTKKDVWKFIVSNDVPYNPLHDQGYPSIGCWPCTRAVQAGYDDRAGRWAGTMKKECGLHVVEHQDGSGI